jgi:hypothetical protein
MKTVFAAILLSLFLAARAESQEAPKLKVAVVNMQRVMNSGMNYDKIRLLSLDKATLAALKKINTEIQEVQTQIVDVNDEVKLMDLGKRLEFLNRKSMLLRQRTMSGESTRDMQSILRRFVIDKFKDKYALIIRQQQDSGYADKVLWKGNAEITDITDDVQEEFQKYLDDSVGDTGRPVRRSRSLIVP